MSLSTLERTIFGMGSDTVCWRGGLCLTTVGDLLRVFALRHSVVPRTTTPGSVGSATPPKVDHHPNGGLPAC